MVLFFSAEIVFKVWRYRSYEIVKLRLERAALLNFTCMAA